MARAKQAGEGFIYPKGETVWMQYHAAGGELRYIMTSKTGDRNTYHVYELADGAFRKLGRGKSPAELEKKYVKWK